LIDATDENPMGLVCPFSGAARVRLWIGLLASGAEFNTELLYIDLGADGLLEFYLAPGDYPQDAASLAMVSSMLDQLAQTVRPLS
jgi:hypothetical protein